MDVVQVVEIIRSKFAQTGSPVDIPLLVPGSFRASLRGDGVEVDNLGNQPFLHWAAFQQAVCVILRNGGTAIRGDAVQSRLGDPGLPLSSVEGHVAHVVYGKRSGDSVFRRIVPIACILVWAGICKAEPNKLVLLDMGEEQKEVFHTITLCQWEEIHAWRKKLAGIGWIFRGQGDASRPLKTSLERACEDFPRDHYLKDPTKAEMLLLREFRRRFHHYLTYTPNKDDCLEWLSLMRHYGAPARLLDFTYSMYIAAYFALEKPKADYAIWAINSKWTVEQSEIINKDNPEASSYFGPLINEKTVGLFPNVFMPKKRERFACAVNPLRLSERLTIQKGIFMCPGDVETAFEENLSALEDHESEQNVIKFVLALSKEERWKALDDLYSLNITRATLFPGLDGFARSLGISPPKFLLPLQDISHLEC